MNRKRSIPEFAVIGHPNEGKSSVLSTLAEDDSVRISPIPGETKECRRFPVKVDGREVIAFIDTPGFQNPRRTLQWMQKYQGPDERLLIDFITAHENDPAFHDDCRLLRPLIDGAGIIFVVDGSRPVRNMDRAEMEILRLTGRPRMAILNCKENETGFLEKWQLEFRKHFNSIRIFNSIQATYSERIALLESLKAIDQSIEKTLEFVIRAFAEDWAARNSKTADLIISLLKEVLTYRRTVSLSAKDNEDNVRKKMQEKFSRFVRKREQATHQQIRRLFKHNIFSPELPAHSILNQDLFAEKTWQFLGLTRAQLVMAGALSGAALAAGIDVAAGGTSLGIFTALGGVLGAAATAARGKELLTGTKLLGVRLDHQQLRIGPVKSVQLMYILLDRVLLFYSLIINWAHGRRNYQKKTELQLGAMGKKGLTSGWTRAEQKICERFFRAVTKEDEAALLHRTGELRRLLIIKLALFSKGEVHQRRDF